MKNRFIRTLTSWSPSALIAALRARPTILFIIAALLIPNTVYLVAIASGIGTPQRFTPIVAYLVVALLARHVSPVAVAVSYFVVLTYDLTSTTSRMFGLSFLEMFTVLQFATEVKVLASMLYAVIALGIFVSTVVALTLLIREQASIRQARLLGPLAVAAVLSVVELSVNSLPHYHFGAAFAAGQPFSSALKASGFETKLNQGQAQRTVMVVMVEGLGVFENPAHQSVIDSPFTQPEIMSRYDVSRGETAYFGSTTAAEMRELCATRSPYQTVMEGPQPACLPAIMAAQGYRTLSVHGFSAGMFDRSQWYPNIGFAQSLFARDFARRGLAQCGAVFTGACDTAIADQLGAIIQKSQDPLFLYWLTLNTHIPITPGEHSGRVSCPNGGVYGDAEVCDMAGMWFDVFDAVAQLAMTGAKTGMDILIVGDHAPPLWSRKQRALFKPGVVPWVLLTAKDANRQ